MLFAELAVQCSLLCLESGRLDVKPRNPSIQVAGHAEIGLQRVKVIGELNILKSLDTIIYLRDAFTTYYIT